MEQQNAQPIDGFVMREAETADAIMVYQPAAAVTGAPPSSGTTPKPTQTSAPLPIPPANQLAYQQFQQFQQHQQQHQQQLQEFWTNRMQEIQHATDYKNHSLPLARVKKIMKTDEEVRMIASEAPVVFAKACEIFILELTLRSWIHTEENKRRTLQKNDIAGAISRTDVFDFLVDIIPRDELREDGLGVPRVPLSAIAGPSIPSVPYYYLPVQHQMAGPAAAAYGVHDPRVVAYMLHQSQAQHTKEEAPAATAAAADA